MIDAYIEALTTIANHVKIKEHTEPNLMWHEDVTASQVKRILYALRLFEDELYKDTRGTISEIPISD